VRPLSADTDFEAERVHLELLRRAGPARRAAMALSLSAQVIGLARRAIRKSHPGASEEEVGLRFVERIYGPELASGLRRFMASRRP
jgi:hypothetical protein